MSRIVLFAVLSSMIAGIPTALAADTLTLRSNAEINGAVEYENDAFTIHARYRGQEKVMTFDRREVLTLEINGRSFNAGEPPRDFSVLDARTPSTREASGGASAAKRDTVKKGQSSGHRSKTALSVTANDDFDRSTTDLVWLKDKSVVAGRLVMLKVGRLILQSPNDSQTKTVDASRIQRILLAPE